MPKKDVSRDLAASCADAGSSTPARCGDGDGVDVGKYCRCGGKPAAAPEEGNRKPGRRRTIATGTVLPPVLLLLLLLLLLPYLAALATGIRSALFTTHRPGGGCLPSPSPLRNSLVDMMGRNGGTARGGSEAAGDDAMGRGGGVAASQARPARGMQWAGALPNSGRSAEGAKGVNIDSGTRSQHYGAVQRRHQEWLAHRAEKLREEVSEQSEAGTAGIAANGNRNRRMEDEAQTSGAGLGLAEDAGERSRGSRASREERLDRLELGGELWNRTYVPPIDPARRLELIDVWSGNAARGNGSERADEEFSGQKEDPASAQGGRILYVISSFDRGQRLGPAFEVDKLDFVLMMMDEMREACEVGFSPRIHLIAAWKVFEVEDLIRDRLFCRRTGEHVPYSFEEHSPDIKNDLSIKHRIFMKPRLEDFDVFLQVEDDVVLTLNHIMLFQEASWRLDHRRRPDGIPVDNLAVPGFIRVEHLGGDRGNFSGPGSSGEEWLEWEVILSRFRALKIHEAGVYFTLGPSSALPHGGNNQGMWMATREQLKKLSSKPSCGYLSFDESSTKGHVETLSGSIQMFRPNCGFRKVFPARQFEGFLVHHRANNKLGIRGESLPGVPISLLRSWVEQFIRDETFLRKDWNPPPAG